MHDACMHNYMHTDRQAGRQADIQTYRHPDIHISTYKLSIQVPYLFCACMCLQTGSVVSLVTKAGLGMTCTFSTPGRGKLTQPFFKSSESQAVAVRAPSPPFLLDGLACQSRTAFGLQGWVKRSGSGTWELGAPQTC